MVYRGAWTSAAHEGRVGVAESERPASGVATCFEDAVVRILQ